MRPRPAAAGCAAAVPAAPPPLATLVVTPVVQHRLVLPRLVQAAPAVHALLARRAWPRPTLYGPTPRPAPRPAPPCVRPNRAPPRRDRRLARSPLRLARPRRPSAPQRRHRVADASATRESHALA